MREDRSPIILAILLFLSLGLHGVVFIGLSFLSLTVDTLGARSEIAFVVETPEPEPLPPEPEEEPPPPPPPPPPPAAAPRVRPPPPDEPPPPPLEETPVAFDNVTLTNDAPSSFTMQESSGVSREGPIGPPGTPTGRRVVGSPTGAPGGTGTAPSAALVVSAANLSRGPRPPGNRDAILERYFPSDERDQGIEGEATVLVTLGPDGRATNVRLVSSSRASFGNACRRMFRDPQMLFTPPLDRQGNPVSTQIQFTCAFDMNF